MYKSDNLSTMPTNTYFNMYIPKLIILLEKITLDNIIYRFNINIKFQIIFYILINYLLLECGWCSRHRLPDHRINRVNWCFYS